MFMPLHFWWVPFLYERLNNKDLFIIGYLSKIGLFFLFRYFFLMKKNIQWLSLILLISFFCGLVGIYLNINNLKIMIGWSRVRKFSLLLLLNCLKILWRGVLLVFYGFNFYLFCRLVKNYDWNLKNLISMMQNNRNKNDVIFFSFIFLNLIGLPPRVLFWVKFIIFSKIILTFGFYFAVLIVLLIFLQIIVYVNIFMLFWYKLNINSWELKYNLQKKYWLVSIFFIFLPFLW